MQIVGRRGRLAAQLLFRSVIRGAAHGIAARRAAFADRSCNAEVDEVHAPFSIDQNVRRLDIAMDDAPLVGMRDS